MQRNPLSDEAINNLSYIERCKLMNDNPVFIERHFQYRVALFFVEILVGCNLLGQLAYYALRVEYQLRGSPHIHCFLWILNLPSLCVDNIGDYISFVDSAIQAFLPDVSIDKELHDLVEKYQTHKHSKSCKKYKDKSCRYNYDRYFTARTIIAIPLSTNLNTEERSFHLSKRGNILSKVKIFIDENLDPRKSSH